MIRSWINGWILTLQFFTVIPLHKKIIPITSENVRRAIQLFPLLGLLQGVVLAFILYCLTEWTILSTLAISFITWLIIIVLTGGIHLDGWIDSSDAFFSYRDQQKRVEILSDPTIGAFGLISAIVLLAVRFLFIYETVQMVHSLTFLLILLIPFFGKLSMGIAVTSIRPIKQTGLGHIFHEASDRMIFIFYTIYVVVVLASFVLFNVEALFIGLLMLLITLLTYIIAKWKVNRWFGGITGDVVGGMTEGVETLLWMIVWLYHYYAMGLH